MVFTPERIKYLLEQARIGREKRGGRDYLTEGDLEAIAHMRDFTHRLETGQIGPCPFHLKHPEKRFPRGLPPKA